MKVLTCQFAHRLGNLILWTLITVPYIYKSIKILGIRKKKDLKNRLSDRNKE